METVTDRIQLLSACQTVQMESGSVSRGGNICLVLFGRTSFFFFFSSCKSVWMKASAKCINVMYT